METRLRTSLYEYVEEKLTDINDENDLLNVNNEILHKLEILVGEKYATKARSENSLKYIANLIQMLYIKESTNKIKGNDEL